MHTAKVLNAWPGESYRMEASLVSTQYQRLSAHVIGATTQKTTTSGLPHVTDEHSLFKDLTLPKI